MLRGAPERMPPPAALGHDLHHAKVRDMHPAAPRLDELGHDDLEIARAHELAHVVGREEPVHPGGIEREPTVDRHDGALHGRLDALCIRLMLKRAELLTQGRLVPGSPDLNGRPGTHVLLPAGEREERTPVRGALRDPPQCLELGLGHHADDALVRVAAAATCGLVAAIDHFAAVAVPMAALDCGEREKVPHRRTLRSVARSAQGALDEQRAGPGAQLLRRHLRVGEQLHGRLLSRLRHGERRAWRTGHCHRDDVGRVWLHGDRRLLGERRLLRALGLLSQGFEPAIQEVR